MRTLDCDVLVIGSGPGGASTACLLAEAGRDVLLVEEGRHLAADSSRDHSLEQMDEKWRSGGLTVALGSPKTTYIEGRCVGGASETNAGLYHPPLADGVDGWARDFGIEAFGADALAPFLAEVEADLGVSKRPGGPGPASMTLAAGADAMGWHWEEIERFWRYHPDGQGGHTGERRSMTETLIPRAVHAGCRLQPNTCVDRIERSGTTARQALATVTDEAGHAEAVAIRFSTVYVCAGAVQTPRILRKSGWTHRIGDTLTMNPMVRIVARFRDPINVPALGVPVVQIEEFKPGMTIGCSYSAPPHLAMWLEGSPEAVAHQLEAWPHLAVFYVKVCGQGRGSVRTMPVFGDALVRYRVPQGDLDHLSEGLVRLSSALFAAGAIEVHSPLPGSEPLTEAGQAERLKGVLTRTNASLSAIHLHSTCPMGERAEQCATDSFGKLRGADNVYVNDSSLLPTSPGVNPQGTILAIARRNIRRHLGA